jgi:hypothetical protein
VSWKAVATIVVIFTGSVTFLKSAQLANACALIVVTVLGISIEERAVFRNELAPIVMRLSGRVTAFNVPIPLKRSFCIKVLVPEKRAWNGRTGGKVFAPIDVRVVGNVTLVNVGTPANRLDWIVVLPSEKITCTSLPVVNAPLAIDVRLAGRVTLVHIGTVLIRPVGIVVLPSENIIELKLVFA